MKYECNFSRGSWNPADWTMVKSPRWDYFGGWVQHDDFIENETPDVCDKNLLRENQELANKTYTSMVLAKPVKGDFRLNVRMSFLDKMAPLVVLASELGYDTKNRPEYRKHFEFVLYDKGVNVWEHFYCPEKGPSWMLRNFLPLKVQPRSIYDVGLELKDCSGFQTVKLKLDGRHKMTSGLDIGNAVFAGITGCEGRNRFYDFELSR